MDAQSVEHMTVSKNGWLDAVITFLGRSLMVAMICWLAVKDWLVSTAPTYPYASSMTISAGILCAAIASVYCRRITRWRDFVVSLGALAAAAYLAFGDSSFFTIRLMPGAGILLCAFAFPLPANPSWNVASQDAGTPRAGRLRRNCYIAAALLGIASFSFGPNFTNFSPQSLMIPIVVIASAIFVRFLVRYCARVQFSSIMPLALSVGIGALYMFSQLHEMPVNSDWSLIGFGSDNTAYGGLQGASLLWDDGLISVTLRCFIVVTALSLNFDQMLIMLRAMKDNSHQSFETREALALSSNALAALFGYSLLCLFYKDIFLAETSFGICIVAFAAASFAIIGRPADAANEAMHKIPWYLRPANIAAFICLICVAVSTGIIVLSCSGKAAEAEREGLSFRTLPQTVKAAMSSEGFETPCTLMDVHAAIRSAFGVKVPVKQTIALDIGMQSVTNIKGPASFKAILGTCIGCVLNECLSKQTVQEAYLSDMNFGAPSKGLASGALYFFHKPVGVLTESDACFLISYRSSNTSPFAGSGLQQNPEYLPSSFSAYHFELFKTWMPGSYRNPAIWLPGWVTHFGAVNNRGDAVGTVMTNDGQEAYVFRSGRISMLPGLGGASDGAAFAINDKGQVAGASGSDACIWDDHGKILDIGTLPGFATCIATSINNRGQVVGYAYNGSLGADKNNRYSMTQSAHAFLWEKGQMRDLGVTPGCLSSRAFGINDAGQVVGWELNDNIQTRAMVWQNGAMQEIGTLGGKVSAATAINNAGVVVGSSQRADGTVAAFLWQNGVMHDLGRLPGDIVSRAAGINNKGQVVGKSYSMTSEWAANDAGGRAFIWDSAHGMRAVVPAPEQGGQTQTTKFVIDNNAPVPMYPSATAYAINDSGQIVGVCYEPGNFGEMRHMFLLTPEK